MTLRARVRLPDAPQGFDRANEQATRRAVEQTFDQLAFVAGPIVIDQSQQIAPITLQASPTLLLVYTCPDGSTGYVPVYHKV